MPDLTTEPLSDGMLIDIAFGVPLAHTVPLHVVVGAVRRFTQRYREVPPDVIASAAGYQLVAQAKTRVKESGTRADTRTQCEDILAAAQDVSVALHILFPPTSPQLRLVRRRP